MADKIDKTKKKLKKRGNPALHKGMTSLNPDGRPKGSKNYLTLLEEALEAEAKKAGITYWERLAQWCFVNPKLASSVLKKFIPDKTHTEINAPEPIMGVFKIITDENNKSNKDIPVADREQGKG